MSVSIDSQYLYADDDRVIDMPGSRYMKRTKLFRVPLTLKNARHMKTVLGLGFSDQVDDWVSEREMLAGRRAVANRMLDGGYDAAKKVFDRLGVREKLPLLRHQVIGGAYALMLPSCHLHMDTGTGKTATAAVVMQHLVDRFDYRRMLVIAPKTILVSGWQEDIDKFSWLKSVVVVDDPKYRRDMTCPVCGREYGRGVPTSHMLEHMLSYETRHGREKAVAALYKKYPRLRPASEIKRVDKIVDVIDGSDARVFLINPEAVRQLSDRIWDWDWDMIILDEASMIKNPQAQITKVMIEASWHVKRRLAMTATPRSNSGLDAWGQSAFVDMALGGSYNFFRDRFFFKKKYLYLPREGIDAEKKIWDIIARRSYRVRLDECVDLPGETVIYHDLPMPKKLMAHYQEMKEKMKVVVDDEEIIARYKIVQINKLAQISAGFVFNGEGEPLLLDGQGSKLAMTSKVVADIVENEGRSVVVWVFFSGAEVEFLKSSLAEFGVSTMYGGTVDREKSIRDFKSGKNKVMVAHPASAKFGHTWVISDVAVFHSYGYSWENFYQAKRRIYRIGQTKPVTYIVMRSIGTIDYKIVNDLFMKGDMSDVMIDGKV